jgi:hypothetical protein
MLLLKFLLCFIKSVRLKSRNLKLHKSVSVCVLNILLSPVYADKKRRKGHEYIMGE